MGYMLQRHKTARIYLGISKSQIWLRRTYVITKVESREGLTSHDNSRTEDNAPGVVLICIDQCARNYEKLIPSFPQRIAFESDIQENRIKRLLLHIVSMEF